MSPMTTRSVPKGKARRMERILAEAIDRHARELMGIEERLILEERIKRLRKKLAA